MTTLQITATITTEMLLEAAAKLSPEELNELVDTVINLRAGQTADSLPQAESGLLEKINRGLPEPLWQRYEHLSKQRRAETLTADDHAELMKLSDQLEVLHAERIKYLIELAQLRKQSLSDLMNELGIQPIDYA
ncbi:MAG: STAS/SEC14 domain-containing protein [Chloroflexi bacterium]|nr:STAS/SEC14 domain-containing protein [Chloroflexota bacterium]